MKVRLEAYLLMHMIFMKIWALEHSEMEHVQYTHAVTRSLCLLVRDGLLIPKNLAQKNVGKQLEPGRVSCFGTSASFLSIILRHQYAG